MAKTISSADDPDYPPHLAAFDPTIHCCRKAWAAECAEWLLDAGGAPFGRTAGGQARRLPLLQRMVGQGPLACNHDD